MLEELHDGSANTNLQLTRLVRLGDEFHGSHIQHGTPQARERLERYFLAPGIRGAYEFLCRYQTGCATLAHLRTVSFSRRQAEGKGASGFRLELHDPGMRL